MRLFAAALLLLAGCQTSSIPYTEIPGTFVAADGEKTAVFTFLVREVSVSRSQGTAWYVQIPEKEAGSLYEKFSGNLSKAGLRVLPAGEVKMHDLVRGGQFRMREEFHLSAEYLPIIQDKRSEELMMRTAPALGVDLFFVILADHSVSRIMLRPASVTASFQLTAYRASAGRAVYSARCENTRQALPYESGTADFQTAYRAIMQRTAILLIEESMQACMEKMLGQPGRPAAEPPKGPIDI